MAEIVGKALLVPINNFDATTNSPQIRFDWYNLPASLNNQSFTCNFIVYDTQGNIVFTDSQTRTVEYADKFKEYYVAFNSQNITSVANGYNYVFTAFITSDDYQPPQITPLTFSCQLETDLYGFTTYYNETAPTRYIFSSIIANIIYNNSKKSVISYQVKLYDLDLKQVLQDSNIIYLTQPSNYIQAGDASYTFTNIPNFNPPPHLGCVGILQGILNLSDNTSVSFYRLVEVGDVFNTEQSSLQIAPDCEKGVVAIKPIGIQPQLQEYLEAEPTHGYISNRYKIPEFNQISLYKYHNNPYDCIYVDKVPDSDLTYIKPFTYINDIPYYRIKKELIVNWESQLRGQLISPWSGTVQFTLESTDDYDKWTASHKETGYTYTDIIYHYKNITAIPPELVKVGITTNDYIGALQFSFIPFGNYGLVYIPDSISTTIYDYTVKSGEQSRYVLSYDNGTSIIATSGISTGTPDWNYVFITDKKNTYKLKANITYGDTKQNKQKGLFAPLNSKYPTIVTNGSSNYQEGQVEALFTNEEFYSTGELGIQTGQEILQFLSDNTVKVLKDWNGNIWMIYIINTPSIQYISDMGNSLVKVSFEWAEIASVNDEKSMRRAGWYNQ